MVSKWKVKKKKKLVSLTERVDSLLNDGGRFAKLVMCDNKGRSQSDDVIVTGLGKQSIVPQPKTKLPRINVCKKFNKYK